MTEAQRIWVQARDRLADAVECIGFPRALGDLLAQQLKSPRGMDRMQRYLLQVRPSSMEMIADELVAICDEMEKWREKKASQEAQATYNTMLFYGMLGQGDQNEEY